MIRRGHQELCITKQCELLSIHRSGLYYKPKGENSLNLQLMRLMDEHYLEHPYKGAARMHVWLTEDLGYKVNLKRIERLFYRVMGLRSISPGPHTSKRNKEHSVYPYLLRNMEITHSNQVWATDITYIPMRKGFMYLTAIIDLYSRYVVGWSVSNTMDSQWIVDMFEEVVKLQGKPEIVNTDQGSQYTAEEFTSFLKNNEIKLSMDGKGRATDNAFIERLWRTVKYEKIYLNPPKDGTDLYLMMTDFFYEYNNNRRHSMLNNKTPIQCYESL